MIPKNLKNSANRSKHLVSGVILVFFVTLLGPLNIFSVNLSQNPEQPVPGEPQNELPRKIDGPRRQLRSTTNTMQWPDTLTTPAVPGGSPEVVGEAFSTNTAADSALSDVKTDEWEQVRVITFNPDPTRAVWMSALFPGLGQLYNRRYWKLPIIIGGFMGLGYATSWNNSMLRDYTRAYADLMDNDPSTKSYMNFFPPTTTEQDLNKTWLQNVLKSRKDYYRRNRDLCIISMVGVYLLAMVDAYVDASLSHFDISPQLSMNVAPAVFQDTRDQLPSVGLQWALNF